MATDNGQVVLSATQKMMLSVAGGLLVAFAAWTGNTLLAMRDSVLTAEIKLEHIQQQIAQAAVDRYTATTALQDFRLRDAQITALAQRLAQVEEAVIRRDRRPEPRRK
jgi:hypothetical protein